MTATPLVAAPVRVALIGAVAAVLLGASARQASGQRPPGADTLSQRAVAESLAVLEEIATAIKRDPRNAALWYRQGMVAWALYDRDRVLAGVDGVDWTRIGRMADTSLRIARELEPENPRYVLTAGQYFLGTGLVTMRTQSFAMFGKALEISRQAEDRDTHAESALEVGRVFWRRYDAVANGTGNMSDAADVRILAQALSRDTVDRGRGLDPERTTAARPFTRRTAAAARRTVMRSTQGTRAFAGEEDYLRAGTYFTEAYEASPTFARAYRQLAMLLAERARWTELEALARDRLAVARDDAWTWMGLGLAVYRLGDTRGATAAFDSALTRMPAYDRARLDRLERVLRPADTLDAATWSADVRASRAREYWRHADPLWADDDVDPRAEFLARVAYAELRWTVEELSQRGSDSDRGIVYVRYGPPDRMATTGDQTEWSYDFYRLRFRFRGAPSFGTMQFTDFGRAHGTIDSIPAIWDNTHLLQIDSIPVQTARFRALALDSVDVYFASAAPVAAIRRATDVAGPVRTNFWLLDNTGAITRHDSTAASVDGGSAAVTRRVAPGQYAYRMEASGSASLVAGRSTGRIDAGDGAEAGAEGFATRGFGVSDLLLARGDAGTRPLSRWRDADITPITGPVPQRGSLTLVWETYDLAERAGSAEYRIAIAIQREQSRIGRIGAQIVSSLGRAVARTASLDRVEFSLDRTVGHSPVLVDQVTLALGGTPAGSYLVSLELTDVATGATARRTTRLVIGDARGN